MRKCWTYQFHDDLRKFFSTEDFLKKSGVCSRRVFEKSSVSLWSISRTRSSSFYTLFIWRKTCLVKKLMEYHYSLAPGLGRRKGHPNLLTLSSHPSLFFTCFFPLSLLQVIYLISFHLFDWKSPFSLSFKIAIMKRGSKWKEEGKPVTLTLVPQLWTSRHESSSTVYSCHSKLVVYIY